MSGEKNKQGLIEDGGDLADVLTDRTSLAALPAPPKENDLMTKDMRDKLDLNKLADNLWTFMSTYDVDWLQADPPFHPKWDIEIFTQLLERGLEALDKQDLVQIIPKGPYTIIGGLDGHGDSLTSLLSIIPSIKGRKVIFLGNYFGMGFARLEVFALVLTLKCLYPENVYMLRGAYEDKSALDGIGLEDMLDRRFVNKILPPTNDWTTGIKYQDITGTRDLTAAEVRQYNNQCEDIDDLLEELLSELSVVALLDDNIVCMYGGPGPTLQTFGLKILYQMEKGEPRTEKEAKAITECLWACMNEDNHQPVTGMPTFSVDEVKKFTKKENIRLLIRSRQLVSNGLLNNPPRVVTLCSSLCFLDQYTNDACALSIDGKKIRIHRIEMLEEEQKTNDRVRMPDGKNQLQLEKK